MSIFNALPITRMPAGDQKGTSDSAVNLTPEVVKAPAVNTDSPVKVTDAERDSIEIELKSIKKTTSRAKSVVGEQK